MSDKIIVGIHQPNFMPWVGYFYKIHRASDFVFLDNIQIETKSKQAFVNRVKVNTGAGETWLTCPISKEKSTSKLIMDIQFVDKFDWRQKILKTLFYNYKKCLYFNDIYPFIEKLICSDYQHLGTYNSEIIMALSKAIGLKTSFHFSSKMNLLSQEKNERLIEICNKLNSCIYLSGKGGMQYHNQELFNNSGITYLDLNFHHPIYSTNKEFRKGLSIIDALFHLGFKGVQELLIQPN